MDWTKSFIVIKQPLLELVIFMNLVAFTVVIRLVIALRPQLHHLHYFEPHLIGLEVLLSRQPIVIAVAPFTI